LPTLNGVMPAALNFTTVALRLFGGALETEMEILDRNSR